MTLASSWSNALATIVLANLIARSFAGARTRKADVSGRPPVVRPAFPLRSDRRAIRSPVSSGQISIRFELGFSLLGAVPSRNAHRATGSGGIADRRPAPAETPAFI